MDRLRLAAIGTLVLCMLAGALAPAAVAQRRPTRESQAFESLSRLLALNADQKKKIKAILSQNAQAMAAVRRNRKLSADQKLVKLEALQAEGQEKIRRVLTPEQQEKLDYFWADVHNRLEERSKP